MINKNCFCILLIFFLVACENSSSRQVYEPQAVTRDDTGYYCNMIVEDHTGPKGQILLTNKENAVWFTSARDAVAFTLLPDEPNNIAAFFVTAMDEAEWNHPEKQINSWIHAKSAWYVIKSKQHVAAWDKWRLYLLNRNSQQVILLKNMEVRLFPTLIFPRTIFWVIPS